MLMRLKRWLSSLGIRKKITYGYALAIGIAVFGTSTGLLVGEYYRQKAVEKLQQSNEEERLLSRLKIVALDSQSHTYKLINILDKNKQFERKNFAIEYYDLLQHLEITNRLYNQLKFSVAREEMFRYLPKDADNLHNFLQIYDGTVEEYTKELEKILSQMPPETLQVSDISQARKTLWDFNVSEVANKFDKLAENLNQIIEVIYQQKSNATAALIYAEKLRITIISTSMLLSIVIATTLAIYTSRAIARPIETLTEFARLVTEEANFERQVTVTSKDEVGQLTTSLNQMLQHISSYTQKLEKSQTQNQALVNAIPDLMLRISKDGIYLDYNSPQNSQVYQTNQNVIGASIYDTLPSEVAQQRMHYIKQALATGKPQIFEYQFSVNGITYEQEARIVVSGKDEVVVIVRDITERKQASKTSQRLAAIIEATPEIVISFDNNGRIFYLNTAGRQILGIDTDEDISTHNFAEYYPQWARKILLEVGLPAATSQGNWSGETAIFNHQGREIPVLQVLIAHTTADGKVEYFSSIARDISDRVHTEELLQRRNSVLNAEQEAALDGILVVDENLNVVCHNSLFVEMWQIPEDIMQSGNAHNICEWLLYQLQNPQDLVAKLNILCTDSIAINSDEIYLKDERVFEVYCGPVVSTEGDYYGRVWYFRDITERKQAEIALQNQAKQLEAAFQELQQMQAQLVQSEKMSSLGQMVAGLAHEINNPVTFIYGNIQYTKDYLQDLLHLLKLYQQEYPQPHPTIQAEIEEIDLDFLASDLPKMIQSMRRGAERIRSLVLSLRNFARLDEGEIKKVNLHEGIDNTLLILSHRLNQGINIIKEYGDLPKVECYPAQLNQVFMNVLSNAIDAVLEAVEQENKQISITTEILPTSEIQVRIRDNGDGIPLEIQSKIFDPFFTTKPVGQGTGLGLAICYQIIRKHRGQITMFSQKGKGCEFAIALPMTQTKVYQC
jgi:PAS domain S-box-containing protein